MKSNWLDYLPSPEQFDDLGGLAEHRSESGAQTAIATMLADAINGASGAGRASSSQVESNQLLIQTKLITALDLMICRLETISKSPARVAATPSSPPLAPLPPPPLPPSPDTVAALSMISGLSSALDARNGACGTNYLAESALEDLQFAVDEGGLGNARVLAKAKDLSRQTIAGEITPRSSAVALARFAGVLKRRLNFDDKPAAA